MKNKKLIIIIAAVVVLALIAAAAILIIGKANSDGASDNKETDNKVYVNIIDKYATNDMKRNILVPERASNAGDSYVKTEINIRAYETFTLTDEEAAKMNDIIAGDKWHLMSAASFSDSAAKSHWNNVLSYSELDISFNSETAYYIIRTSDGSYISASDFKPASGCQIAIFDTADNSYHYIRFDI